MKTCTKCKEIKILNLFGKDKSTRDGLKPSCRECMNLQGRQKRNGTFKSTRIYIRSDDTIAKCRQCDQTKPIEEFCLGSKKSPSGRTRLCKNCKAENERVIRAADPKIARGRNLKSNYNITVEDWELILLSQDYLCAVCHTDSPGHKTGWRTDHHHETGQVRGILCHWCNITVGHVESGWNVEVPAINNYLKRWERCRTKSLSRMVNSA